MLPPGFLPCCCSLDLSLVRNSFYSNEKKLLILAYTYNKSQLADDNNRKLVTFFVMKTFLVISFFFKIAKSFTFLFVFLSFKTLLIEIKENFFKNSVESNESFHFTIPMFWFFFTFYIFYRYELMKQPRTQIFDF